MLLPTINVLILKNVENKKIDIAPLGKQWIKILAELF